MNVQYEGVKVQLVRYVYSYKFSWKYSVYCTVYNIHFITAVYKCAVSRSTYVQLHILSTLTAVCEGGLAVHVPLFVHTVYTHVQLQV